MTVTLRGRRTSAAYDVTGEARMRSYLGPDAMMEPFEAVITTIDGALTEVAVLGRIVGMTGKTTTKVTAIHLFRKDLIGEQSPPEDMDPDDWEPVEVPAWVRDLPEVRDLPGVPA